MRHVLIWVYCLCLLGALSACGKKGSPEPPGPASDIIYPHIYPSH